ncbi:HNH endonuclease [Primorskyibacter sp. 2E233]|uniref:HNH endonuclease n=1 Tax=Primorskyibacter sp. 2E233 TaxID=3413431 RepID=UPI003BF1C8AC
MQDLEPRASRDWWADTYQNHAEDLAQRIKRCLTKARLAPTGCLVLKADTAKAEATPARIHWRGRRQKVYQLVAWGLSGDLPLKRSVIRHLCNNRLCIRPDHLRVGTQAQNLRDQRVRAADHWTHL